MRRKTWKGGPRSRRSYIMDYHRQSEQTHEQSQQKKGRYGVTSVRPHYRKTKRGRTTKVKYHKRRY